MQIVGSFEDLQRQVAAIRSLRLGFATNYFPDAGKNAFWIRKGDCYTARESNTLFIIKKTSAFWNVFYCSTSLDELGKDLGQFLAKHGKGILLFDIVGRAGQCQPFVNLFREKGFKDATSLVRMMRMTEPMAYVPDDTIRRATGADIPEIGQLLRTYFDEQTEQIPYDEELVDYANLGHVLVCEENGAIAGFLIYGINASTLSLRYWFTRPEFRGRKVGARLIRRFFEEGKTTKRQLLWVIRSNKNAISRYHHYGFSAENMYDYVMKYQQKEC